MSEASQRLGAAYRQLWETHKDVESFANPELTEFWSLLKFLAFRTLGLENQWRFAKEHLLKSSPTGLGNQFREIWEDGERLGSRELYEQILEQQWLANIQEKSNFPELWTMHYHALILFHQYQLFLFDEIVSTHRTLYPLAIDSEFVDYQLYSQSVVCRALFNLRRFREFKVEIERFLSDSSKVGDDKMTLLAHLLYTEYYMTLGQFKPAETYLKKAKPIDSRLKYSYYDDLIRNYSGALNGFFGRTKAVQSEWEALNENIVVAKRRKIEVTWTSKYVLQSHLALTELDFQQGRTLFQKEIERHPALMGQRLGRDLSLLALYDPSPPPWITLNQLSQLIDSGASKDMGFSWLPLRKMQFCLKEGRWDNSDETQLQAFIEDPSSQNLCPLKLEILRTALFKSLLKDPLPEAKLKLKQLLSYSKLHDLQFEYFLHSKLLNLMESPNRKLDLSRRTKTDYEISDQEFMAIWPFSILFNERAEELQRDHIHSTLHRLLVPSSTLQTHRLLSYFLGSESLQRSKKEIEKHIWFDKKHGDKSRVHSLIQGLNRFLDQSNLSSIQVQRIDENLFQLALVNPIRHHKISLSMVTKWLQRFSAGEEVDTNDLITHFDIARRTAQRMLVQLNQQGSIECVGQGRARRCFVRKGRD